jgi:hypothetical protein
MILAQMDFAFPITVNKTEFLPVAQVMLRVLLMGIIVGIIYVQAICVRTMAQRIVVMALLAQPMDAPMGCAPTQGPDIPVAPQMPCALDMKICVFLLYAKTMCVCTMEPSIAPQTQTNAMRTGVNIQTEIVLPIISVGAVTYAVPLVAPLLLDANTLQLSLVPVITMFAQWTRAMVQPGCANTRQ